MLHRDAGRRQRRVGLGERRRDHRGQLRAQVRQQGEPLGGPGQQRDLVDGPAVPGGDGLDRRALVVGARVARQVGQPCGQPLHQPGRRLRGADVDGEVQHAGRAAWSPW